MSVIVARALPDARDGLKPVHRRILYAMHDMGVRAGSPYKKSPYRGRSAGPSITRTAIPPSIRRNGTHGARISPMRYPLIDGQGNFGSIDGDAPAAMRYTEARLNRLAEEMLADIEKDTVNFVPNFDDSLQEPQVLPARLPNLLLNGSSGIAVGMATNIPPHNLRELAAAIAYLIENYENIENIPVETLMQFITGPDFPTGGGHHRARGHSARLFDRQRAAGGAVPRSGRHRGDERRAAAHRHRRNPLPGEQSQLSSNGLPNWCARRKIDQISDLRDESDQRGMSIVIELKRGAQPKKVLNQLYKFTPLQSTFGVRLAGAGGGRTAHARPQTRPAKFSSNTAGKSSPAAPATNSKKPAPARPRCWKAC